MRRFGSQLRQGFAEDPLFACFCAGLFLLPLSNSVGQVPLYAGAILWTWKSIREPVRLERTGMVFLAGYALLIVLSLIWSTRPMNGVDKLNRLLLFPMVLALPALLEGHDRRKRLLLAFILGTALLGIQDLIRVPWEVFHLGKPFFKTGNMTDPQFYMTALLLLLGLGVGPSRLPHLQWTVLLSLCVSGLLLHNKRGVWLACLIAVGVWGIWRRQYRLLLGTALVGALALCLPSVRHRLGDVKDLLNASHGSRLTLWEETAPRLLPSYPFGMGYNASEFEDFRRVTPREIHIEPGLRHLHNNFLQTRLELGWQGLVWWTAWMGWALVQGFGSRQGVDPLRAAAACALLGLLLNGLVEYNFGDSEVLMVYLALLGITSCRSAVPG